MVSVEAEKHRKRGSHKTSKPLAPKPHKIANIKNKKKKNEAKVDEKINDDCFLASASEQHNFFLNEFQSANDIQLSSLELESIKGPISTSL